MDRIRTLFIGSNWESLEILKSIYRDNGFEIVGLITQPDKPVGRKQVITPTEVKAFGVENNIPVFITEGVEEKYRVAFDTLKPDLVVCIAFGEFIPNFFLTEPKFKAINIHFSLLPKYRGAVPIQMAILDGEKETGISVVQMVEKMDAGPVLAMFKEQIRDDDTNQSLRERLVNISAEVLPDILTRWTSGEIHTIDQDEKAATYCYKKDIEKEKMEIKFDVMEAETIDRMVRASIPWPVAWASLFGQRTKIYKVRVFDEFETLDPGEILDDRKRLVIGTKNRRIEILELQPEGKNVMNAGQFLAGKH